MGWLCHNIAPHLANKMIPPENFHVLMRIILILAVQTPDEMLNPFYIFHCSICSVYCLDTAAATKKNIKRYANLLKLMQA